MTSNCGKCTLSIFDTTDSAEGAISHIATLGGVGKGPLQFQFAAGDGSSGGICFSPSSPRELLVADHGNNRVQVVDVVSHSYLWDFCGPGTVKGPRAVAASSSGSLVVVSAWLYSSHGIHVFDSTTKAHLRAIGLGYGSDDGQLNCPYGLKVSVDGTFLCVADSGNHRVSVFSVGDGGFLGHLVTGVRDVTDVLECAGGWLFASRSSNTVEYVRGAGPHAVSPGASGGGRGGSGRSSLESVSPSALGFLPGGGLFVRGWGPGLLCMYRV